MRTQKRRRAQLLTEKCSAPKTTPCESSSPPDRASWAKSLDSLFFTMRKELSFCFFSLFVQRLTRRLVLKGLVSNPKVQICKSGLVLSSLGGDAGRNDVLRLRVAGKAHLCVAGTVVDHHRLKHQ
jgi:hypothetical protein